MARFTQENRHVKITSPLGTDKLLITGMQGNEGISRLFNFELSLVSEDKGIPFADIIGKGVTVSIELPSGDWRYFNGIISSFSQVSGDTTSSDDTTRAAFYRANLVPKLWLLTRSAELRIFQNLTVPEIIEKVLKQFEITDYELKLQGDFKKRDYCVQYRETHFNFISRLLEEEGIFYFFEHNTDNHKLIIANSSQANAPCPGQKSASYQVENTSDDDTISSLEKMQMILPGKYMLRDFDFEKPNNSLNVDSPGRYKLGPGDREIYDYPGGYTANDAGNTLVKVRMEEKEAQVTTVRGGGKCRAFTSGYRFTLLNADLSDMNNKEFILTAVAHNLSQSVRGGGEFDYGNSFCCIPADVPFRPPRVTPKPVVQGTQTAIVVGPSGNDEIYTDKHGRIKVQFHWDREGKGDQNSSCWIRVSQIWAGTGWGGLFIPRIGHEVIVDFLEGDPDCPIVIGRVYNGINVPPTSLPENKTYSVIKSNSTPGGGGFNGINFIDSKDKEQFDIHAQKNMCTRVLKDCIDWIGNDRHMLVKNDQIEKVEKDKHLTVIGDQNEKVDGAVSLSAGEVHMKSGGIFAVDAGEIHLKAGSKIVIEAPQVSIKGGGSYIDIQGSGVTISGPKVHVGGSGSVTIDGGMVKINCGGSGGSAASGSGASPDPPLEPQDLKAESGGTGTQPAPSSSSAPPGPQATALKQAAQSGAPFCST